MKTNARTQNNVSWYGSSFRPSSLTINGRCANTIINDPLVSAKSISVLGCEDYVCNIAYTEMIEYFNQMTSKPYIFRKDLLDYDEGEET